ncbi:hypothetical protein ACJ73_10119 [Blastomyces percursus]|uniref:Uncharacterized protein n=1 Tax=Blastomyces percursus TaxID=1658174 RepID=A0A1J9NYP6_9EURO|nr:hypothetical protein ACJ73_10119 [Blastomyces percursus]
MYQQCLMKVPIRMCNGALRLQLKMRMESLRF